MRNLYLPVDEFVQIDRPRATLQNDVLLLLSRVTSVGGRTWGKHVGGHFHMLHKDIRQTWHLMIRGRDAPFGIHEITGYRLRVVPLYHARLPVIRHFRDSSECNVHPFPHVYQPPFLGNHPGSDL